MQGSSVQLFSLDLVKGASFPFSDLMNTYSLFVACLAIFLAVNKAC